jgi:hypothetical protein
VNKRHKLEISNLEPLAVSKRHAYVLIGYPKLVQRWLYWSRRAKTPEERWVIIVREGKRGTETLIDYQSLKSAYQKFKNGIEPPKLPSEGGKP